MIEPEFKIQSLVPALDSKAPSLKKKKKKKKIGRTDILRISNFGQGENRIQDLIGLSKVCNLECKSIPDVAA